MEISKLIKIYLIAFLIFGVIGLIKGHRDVNSPEYLQLEAFRNIKLVSKEPSNGPSEAYQLICRNNDEVLYRFDIDTNKLEKTTEAFKLQAQEESKAVLNFPIDGDTIMLLLGGSTAGYTVKDLLSSQVWKATVKRVIAGILGAISGYSLGYELAIHLSPGPESQKIRQILDNEQQWVAYEKTFYRRIILRTFLAMQLNKDEKEVKSLQSISDSFIRLLDNNQDKHSSDFTYISSFYNKIIKTVPAKDLEKLNKHKDYLEVDWWMVVLPFFLFLSLIGFYAWKYSGQRRGAIQESTVQAESTQLIHLPSDEEIGKFGKSRRK